MKIKCQYTIEIDPDKVRAEFGADKNEMSNKNVREYFATYGRDAVEAYIERIGVKVDE